MGDCGIFSTNPPKLTSLAFLAHSPGCMVAFCEEACAEWLQVVLPIVCDRDGQNGTVNSSTRSKLTMSNPEPSVTESNLDELPRELTELGQRIALLPDAHRQDLLLAYGQVVDCVRRRRRILNLVQEALSQLRLDIKYLMFDLEMTRKERDAFKERLDQDNE